MNEWSLRRKDSFEIEIRAKEIGIKGYGIRKDRCNGFWDRDLMRGLKSEAFHKNYFIFRSVTCIEDESLNQSGEIWLWRSFDFKISDTYFTFSKSFIFSLGKCCLNNIKLYCTDFRTWDCFLCFIYTCNWLWRT